MRVLVTGGRWYRDADAVARELAAARPSVVIHGAAAGADALADQWATARGVKVARRPARWRDRDGTYDPAAGFRRNQTMLDDDAPDVVLAFPGGRGTADMIRRARRAGVPVREVVAPGAWGDLLG